MPRDSKPSKQSAPAAEWAVGILGMLLVAAGLVFLGLEAVRDQGLPPDLRIAAEPPLALKNGWLVRITVRNEGESTAANVIVEGELAGPDGTVQRSEVQFDFAPPKSDRKGGLFFTLDPGRHELRLRALGYMEP